MAAREVTQDWTVRIASDTDRDLRNHLFPGDGQPHGAALIAGIHRTPRGGRLLVRKVIKARDGIDYLPGRDGRGHHRLSANFVRDAVVRAMDGGFAYLPVHIHGGTTSVGFSPQDLGSHARGYPALVDLLAGPPVAPLVFTEQAVGGQVWSESGAAGIVRGYVVVGTQTRTFRDAPTAESRRDVTFDRQARIFGDAGQVLLGSLKVGVIGCGGVGMLLVEYLARLGVGRLVVVDPDRVEPSNLPRLPGSRRRDALEPFASSSFELLRRTAQRFAKPKVRLAERLGREAPGATVVEGVFADVREPAVAARLLDCDYLFLAANSHQARFLFNAICQQFLIPGAQIGAKVRTDPTSGNVTDVHSIVRPVLPGRGCLMCNAVISRSRITEEAADPAQRRAQRYVDDPGVEAPSVITLNASATAIAANDFLFTMTGLTAAEARPDWLKIAPASRDVFMIGPRQDAACPECSLGGRFGRGDGGARLPTFFRG